MMETVQDFTGCQYYTYDDGKDTPVNIGIKFTRFDGLVESRSLTDPEVAAWIAAGGTPLPAGN
jgi:hypothetical protein